MQRILPWILLVVVIIFRYYTAIPHYENGQQLRVSAKVMNEPLQFSGKQYLTLAGLKIYLPAYPRIYYGDRVVVEGKVNQGRLENAKLIKVDPAVSALYQLRQKLVNFYQHNLPAPHSSLIAGMVVGSKSNLPQDFWQHLTFTGTAHVVVASGMNVMLVAGFFLNLFLALLKRRTAIIFTLLTIWLYAIFAGLEAPIVRAAIMASLTFMAQGLGKVSFSGRVLGLSAAIMLIVRPQWLTDIGFILSFAATASLIYFTPKVQKYLKSVPGFLKEDLTTTLAAQIGVAPIIILAFGRFNIQSPLINVLILWTIVPITLIGTIAGTIGVVYEPLGKLILYLAYPLTWWFVKVVEIFS